MGKKINKGILVLCFIMLTISITACSENSNNSVSSNKKYNENSETNIPEKTSMEKELENTISNNEPETVVTAKDYEEAIDDETKKHILDVAKEYYSKLKFLKVTSMEISNNYAGYQNKGIEDEYSVGNILIFDVKAIIDGEEYMRTISVAKDVSGEWKVINEGYCLCD